MRGFQRFTGSVYFAAALALAWTAGTRGSLAYADEATPPSSGEGLQEAPTESEETSLEFLPPAPEAPVDNTQTGQTTDDRKQMVEKSLEALTSGIKGMNSADRCGEDLGKNIGPRASELWSRISRIMVEFDGISKPTDDQRKAAVEELLAILYKKNDPSAAEFRELLKNRSDTPALNGDRGKLRGFIIDAVARIQGRIGKRKLYQWEINRMSESLQGKAAAGRLPSRYAVDPPDAIQLDFRVLARRAGSGVKAMQSYYMSQGNERYGEVMERHPGGGIARAEAILGARIKAPDDRFCAQALVVMARQVAKAGNIRLVIKDEKVAKKISGAVPEQIRRRDLLNNRDGLSLFLITEKQKRRNGKWGNHAFGVNATIDPETMKLNYRRINFNRNRSGELANSGSGKNSFAGNVMGASIDKIGVVNSAMSDPI